MRKNTEKKTESDTFNSLNEIALNLSFLNSGVIQVFPDIQKWMRDTPGPHLLYKPAAREKEESPRRNTM